MIAVGLQASISDAAAQSPPRTNVDILGDLAVRCIGSVPDTVSAFLVSPTPRMPYLRPRLTTHWQGQGHQVFVSDSLAPSGLTQLAYDAESAGVLYGSAEEDALDRTVQLVIRHSLVTGSGLLLDEGRCDESATDVIQRSEVALVERDPYPEAKGAVPEQGSWRDWAEPVVLGAAVGVVAYLFFTVRSS